MPRSELGPWGKWYASTEEDTAHYTDVEFRAWAGIFSRAVRNRGELPKLRPLKALYGDAVRFLIEEGRLIVGEKDRVEIADWPIYNAPRDGTAAVRQARRRARLQQVDNAVDNVTSRVSHAVTSALPSTSTSTSTPEENEGVAVNGFDRADPLDAFYLTTNEYPQPGGKLARWIVDVAAKGPSPRDFGVVFADEFRQDTDVRKALKATEARLSKQADRVIQAAEQQRREKPPSPEDAAFRAALVATGRYEAPVNGSRGGPLTKIGDLLESATDGSATSPVSAVERSVTDPAADEVEANSFAPHRDRHPNGRPTNPDGQG